MKWMNNWERTRERFCQWWKREGLLVSPHGLPRLTPHATVNAPAYPDSVREAYEDGKARAQRNHQTMASLDFQGDTLAVPDINIGPGSLALFLGSEPGFSPDTVWFDPCIHENDNPETLPPLVFNPQSHWWKVTEETCRETVKWADGHYLAGCPDLVENIDILSAMRDPQTLMIDMIERPEWVEAKVAEINIAFFEAYQRIYEIIKQPDGSSCFAAFALWGPGKTAKVQCDACAMFSPAMFRRFVAPALKEQCEWLDYSMYHLDGTQCIDKLDELLQIEALDAIEWTPQAGIETGGDPRWYDLYRRILAGGKSLQAIEVKVHEIQPLLDTIGPKGVYLTVDAKNEADVEQAIAIGDRYR